MQTTIEDEDLLMAVLNSAPVIDGVRSETLAGPPGAHLVGEFGGTGSPRELGALRDVREVLQVIVRGEDGDPEYLAPFIAAATLRPSVDSTGIGWELDAPPDERLAVRTVLAWGRFTDALPGRLRPCANTDCNLFLADHSRPGTAKWCSMATCGNRMKARAHAQRRRQATTDGP